MNTRTLSKRTAQLETQSLSHVEEAILSHFTRKNGRSEEIRSQWRRTREKIGYTVAEEEAFGEYLDRLPAIVAGIENVGGKKAAMERANGPDFTEQECEAASRRLHSQPPATLRAYVKGLELRELWATLLPKVDRHGKLIEANPDRPFWDL